MLHIPAGVSESAGQDSGLANKTLESQSIPSGKGPARILRVQTTQKSHPVHPWDVVQMLLSSGSQDRFPRLSPDSSCLFFGVWRKDRALQQKRWEKEVEDEDSMDI